MNWPIKTTATMSVETGLQRDGTTMTATLEALEGGFEDE